MNEQSMPIRSILVVGGGTAGWMAATWLAGRLARQGVAITVVESAQIGTVGVGEATVPAIRDYFRDINVDEAEVLAATEGTLKLGIEFEGWNRPGGRFFHPFGLYGMPSRGVPFHQFWLRRRAQGDPTPLEAYSLCTQMALSGLVAEPPETPPNDLGVFNWAIHFDASLYAQFLRRKATSELGVVHVEGVVADVARDTQSGLLTGVTLADGRRLAADLFIDCSGFRSLLLGQALGVDYEDWTHLLPCDRAVAMPCERVGPLSPYTRSTALAAGWQWRIPLRHRVGNGYVYSSRHISDDEAASVLAKRLEGKPLADPNFLRFTTGHRRRFWERNCIALGLAAGFMEPLESTSIVLIQSGVERLGRLFPDRTFDPALAEEYNRVTTLEYERIRDFLLLHYVANGRVGEALWDAVRALAIPESLARKMRLFEARGAFIRHEWESFQDPSWLSMYAGFERLPRRHDPMADYFTDAELDSALGRIREAIGRAKALATPHEAFLARMLSPSGTP